MTARNSNNIDYRPARCGLFLVAMGYLRMKKYLKPVGLVLATIVLVVLAFNIALNVVWS